MSRRVTPSEQLRAEVDEVFAGGADLATMIEQVAWVGARLLLQTALEAEVTEFRSGAATRAPRPAQTMFGRGAATDTARPRSRPSAGR